MDVIDVGAVVAFLQFYPQWFTIFYYKSHILLFPCPTPFCLPPALSYFCFKLYFLRFLAWFLNPTYYFSPLYPLKISFLSFRHLTIFFIVSFFFLCYNIIILFPPLSIFAPLSWILLWWQFFFNLVPIFSLFFSPKTHIVFFPCLISVSPIFSLFYLCGTFYFLLFFTLFRFPTLIYLPPTLTKSFFFMLVTSHSFFLLHNILILI